MAKDPSVAPKERVNIVYKPATGDAQEEKELPLKLLMLGDYTQQEDDTPLEDRKAIDVSKDNFDDVMASQKLSLTMNVANELTGEAPAEGEEQPQLSVKVDFKSIKDFGPEAVAETVPELKKLLELRAALHALKGPLGNVPAFRKKIESLIGDVAAREKLLEELGDEGEE